MRDVVVLHSGGLDSTTLAQMVNDSGRLAASVFIDYGQPALEQEGRAVRRWCGLNHVRLVVSAVDIPGARESMYLGTGVPGSRVIANRNAIMLSLAAAAAVGLGAREVWYGATAADAFDYPDCRPDFAAALSYALELACGIRVRCPFASMERAEVRALSVALQVVSDCVWSCYQPTDAGEPCGACNSCCQEEAR